MSYHEMENLERRRDVMSTNKERKKSSSSKEKTAYESKESMEVDYKSNPTTLFKLIEDHDWESIIDHSIHHPKEVETWVKSSDPDTLFTWSVWRRLPIHEACRRKPPLEIIYHLLKMYPESANEVTQFGEMPLHCAIGCGASADVIHFLVTWNPFAVLCRDKGGRGPVEIIRTRGALVEEDERIIEGLERCKMKLNSQRHFFETERKKMKAQHMKQLKSLKSKGLEHSFVKEKEMDSLTKKQAKSKDQIKQLLETLKVYEQKVSEASETEERLLQKVSLLTKEGRELTAGTLQMKNDLLAAKQRNQEQEEKIQDLSNVVENLLLEMHEMVDQNFRSLRQSKALETRLEALQKKQHTLNMKGNKRIDLLRKSALKAARKTAAITQSDSKVFQMDFLPSDIQILQQTQKQQANSPEKSPLTKKNFSQRSVVHEIDDDNMSYASSVAHSVFDMTNNFD